VYYFIFEQPLTRKQSELAQQIEDQVVADGIAGELVVADAYTDIDQLLAAAHHKDFHTVVVVGSPRLANHVAARLIRYEMALGIIPWDAAPSLNELIGCHDWQSAVAAVKKRRWKYVALGRLGDQGVFLSEATLEIKRSSEIIRLRTSSYAALFNATTVTLSCTTRGLKDHQVVFTCETVAPELTSWQRFWGKKAAGPLSRFALEAFTLESETPLQVILDGEVIATTPVAISTLPRAVRLIVARRQVQSRPESIAPVTSRRSVVSEEEDPRRAELLAGPDHI
jgi:hypothetical protein